MKRLVFVLILCLSPFLLGVSPFVRTDGEPQVQGPLKVYNTLNVTGVCTMDDDLIVDGGEIGVTGDLDLLQLSSGDLDVNGTSEFVGNMTLPATNPTGDTYSYEIILQAHNTASPGDETQVSKIFTAPDPGGAFGAYLVIAAPNAAGTATDVFVIKHDLFGFNTDDYVDIGSTGANRPKDIFLAGNLDAEVGSITAQTGLTTDTGDVTATAGAVLAGTTVTATGDLIVNGGEIGLSTDLDLFQIDVEEVTINGDVAIIGEMSATDITASTGDVIAGNDLLGRFAAYSVIPIEWCHDGAVAPAAAAEVTSGNGAVQAREFGAAAGDTVQDVVCPWHVPSDIVAGSGIKFMVTSVLADADTIANQNISFKMSGDCVGTNDPLGVTFGTEVEVTPGSLTAAQFDIVHTPYSGVVTVDDLAAGELAQLHFERDTADADDDYDAPVGVIYIVIKYEKLTAGF